VYGGTGIQVATGTGFAIVAQAKYKLSTAGYFLPTIQSGAKMYASWSIRAVGTSTSNTFFRVALNDAAANSVGFYLAGSASTTIWNIIGTAGGSAFQTPGTGAGATLDFTAPHRFAVATDGVTMTFYVDGVSIGSSTALSAAPAGSMEMVINVQNSTDVTNYQLNCDEFFAAWVGTL
jgi:hypothetical protein